MKNLPSGVEIVAGGAIVSGMVQTASGAETNIFETSSEVDGFVALTGNDFYYEGDSEFSLTAEGCILTYTGVDIDVLVLVQATLQSSNSLSDAFVALCASFNGDIIGAGTLFSNAMIRAGGCIAGLNTGIIQSRTAVPMVQRRLTLSSGDTIQPIAGANISTDLTAFAMSMSVTKVKNA